MSINIRMSRGDDMTGVGLGVRGVSSESFGVCGDDTANLWRTGVGTRIGLGGDRRARRARGYRKGIERWLSLGPNGRTGLAEEKEAGSRGNKPEFRRIDTRVWAGDRPASLSEIALSITKTTWYFRSFTGLTFCFWGWLKTLNFLETTRVFEKKMRYREKEGRERGGREAYQLSQEVTSLGRFL